MMSLVMDSFVSLVNGMNESLHSTLIPATAYARGDGGRGEGGIDALARHVGGGALKEILHAHRVVCVDHALQVVDEPLAKVADVVPRAPTTEQDAGVPGFRARAQVLHDGLAAARRAREDELLL